MVGGDYIGRNYEAAAVDGRIVQIAFQGPSTATVDFRRLMLKRLTHTGSTLRSRSVAEKAAIARALEEKVWPIVAAGRCRPVIHAVMPLAQCRTGPCADGEQRAYRQDRAVGRLKRLAHDRRRRNRRR